MSEIPVFTAGIQNADITGGTNSAIQAAIDKAAAAGGGTVRILPGRYAMHDSLHLRSHVTVEGAGGDTVLWKPACVSSPLCVNSGYGHYDISIADPERFRVGMGIKISDDNAGGFYNTVGTITAIYGDTLVIDRMLNHDYNLSANAKAVSVYPVVSGIGLEGACIRSLTIEGNAAGNEAIDGCRGGGVYLLRCRDTVIGDITVRDYNGDGISFQQCVNTRIEACVCAHNAGNGLHPGSGSVVSMIHGTECVKNGADGVFLCLRATRTFFDGCRFSENAKSGISIGHRDTDIEIKNCSIRYNGFCGIVFREDALGLTGNRTLITENEIGGNGAAGGNADIYFQSGPSDVYIYSNPGLLETRVKAERSAYMKDVRCRSKAGFSVDTEIKNRTELNHLGIGHSPV